MGYSLENSRITISKSLWVKSIANQISVACENMILCIKKINTVFG